MTDYPRDNWRVIYYDADPDLAGKLARDEQWAIGAGMTEVETLRVTERTFSRPQPSPPDNPPWWHALKVGDLVRPRAVGVPVLFASGALFRRSVADEKWAVWAPGVDVAGGRVCVYSGDEARYPGGLWVAGADLAPAE